MRVSFLPFLPVLACLCAFAVFPIHQLAGMMWAESSETECAAEESGERAVEEFVVRSSTRHRSKDQRRRELDRPHKTPARSRQVTPSDRRSLAIVGHQLANGLCAPLQI